MNYYPHRSAVLEASAGTGKTYTIEQLFANALVESSPLVERPLLVKEILVVTFTKAAAAELKERIRGNLFKLLQDPQKKRWIQAALADFDSASIFTIHGFCFRALQEQAFESGTPFSLQGEFRDEALFELVEKVLRGQTNEDFISPKQMQSLLGDYRQKPLELVRDLVAKLKEGTPCEETRNNHACWEAFNATLSSFKEESFDSLYRCYNKTKEWDAEILGTLQRVLSDRKISYKEFLDIAPAVLTQLKYFLPSNVSKKGPGPSPLGEALVQKWLPLFREMAAPPHLFLRLLSLCQKRLVEEVKKEGPLSFQGLIERMRDAVVNQPEFRKKLQDRYRLVLIDEFQDTDPLQWDIFKTLFLNEQHHLILVGDPKQSIYGFRGADIYTYLNASKVFSESREALSTNYRSSQRLVHAMNRLFGLSESWIPLPLIGQHLNYQSVLAGVTKEPIIPNDEPVLSFLLAESEEALYPYYAKEVVRLHEERSIAFSEIAFIVRDHRQATALYHYFKSMGIPAELQKSASLQDSEAFDEIADLLQALSKPRDQSLIKKALCGRIMGYAPDSIAQLENSEEYLELLALFIEMREESRERGAASILFDFLEKAKTRILLEEEGVHFLSQAATLIEQLLLVPSNKPEELLLEMQSWKNSHLEGKSSLRGQGVPIITMHYSKGLEYLCVFAHGVSSRPPLDQGLVKLRTDSGQKLVPLFEEDPLYLQYIDEADAEKARQLYVALTRAKEKLYIPYIQERKMPAMGKASPLELFLAHVAAKEKDREALYEVMSKAAFGPFFEGLADSHIEVRKIDAEVVQKYQQQEISSQLVQPSLIQFNYPSLYQFSFSSLAKPAASLGHREGVSESAIPLGQETGILLHELLEKLPWEQVRKAQQPNDFLSFVEQKLKGTSYAPWSLSISEILFQALSVTLPGIDVSLKGVDEAHLFREMEFHYLSEGHVYKGVIDLVFFHRNRYYIVDWKSNWLSAYAPSDLEEEMRRHDYYLQVEIYKKAVQKYARIMDSAFSYGGAYYLFLRGLNEGKGVVWIAP